jgi:hypothetical protein
MKAQVATTVSPESGMLLKTIGARRGTRDGGQDQGAKVQASLTDFSRTDRTVLDYGVYAGHRARR